jgi:tungstate transport system ATP-binding protein
MKPDNIAQIAVEAKGLTTVLGGTNIIDVASFQVRTGEVLMIIGPNGSGKTTLLLSLALLIKLATGQVLYQGVPIESPRQILETRRKISVLFQESLLLSSTVWDNVMLGLRLRGVKKEEAAPRVEKWLKRFGVAQLAKRQALTLSGGEAKRVSLARAFVLDPDVIFLDEPFTALDSPTRQALLEEFESVLRETRVTAVMVTHERNEALALGDRIAVIMNGSIVQTGTTDEVFSAPANEEIANFVEAGNVLHGIVEEINEGLARVKVSQKEIDACCELPIGNKVILLVPYDDVTILLPPAGQMITSARNRFKGRVVKVFPSGSQIRVTIDCGFPLTALVTKRSVVEMGLKEGVEVLATVKATSIRVIGRH